jgi:hypothetical protein
MIYVTSTHRSDGTNQGKDINAFDLNGEILWSYKFGYNDNDMLVFKCAKLLSNGDIALIFNLSKQETNYEITSILCARLTKTGQIVYSKQIIPPGDYQEFKTNSIVERENGNLLIGGGLEVAVLEFQSDYQNSIIELSPDGNVAQSYSFNTYQDNRIIRFSNFIKSDTSEIALFYDEFNAQFSFYNIPSYLSDMELIKNYIPPIDFNYYNSQMSDRQETKKINENYWAFGAVKCGTKYYFTISKHKPDFSSACETEKSEFAITDTIISYETVDYPVPGSFILNSTSSALTFEDYITPTFHDLCLGCGVLDIPSTEYFHSFSSYPNPSSGMIKLEVSQSLINTEWKLYNSLYQLIKKGSIPDNNILDFTDICNGMYLIGMNNHFERIIINHE